MKDRIWVTTHLKHVLAPPGAYSVWLPSEDDGTVEGPLAVVFFAVRDTSWRYQGRAFRSAESKFCGVEVDGWADSAVEQSGDSELQDWTRVLVMVQRDWECRWYELNKDCFWTRQGASDWLAEKEAQRLAQGANKIMDQVIDKLRARGDVPADVKVKEIAIRHEETCRCDAATQAPCDCNPVLVSLNGESV